MNCPDCGGWMSPEKDEICTERGLKVEEYLVCQECGAEDPEPDVLDLLAAKEHRLDWWM